MRAEVLDAGIAIGWLRRRHRSFKKIENLLHSCREGKISLAISAVNLAEVIIHTRDLAQSTGVDPVSLLKSAGVRIQSPDEAIARRVAKLNTSLADGFAAATAQELGARFHTTDSELIRQLRGTRLAISRY